MKKSPAPKYIKHLKEIEKSGISIKKYCSNNNIPYSSIVNYRYNLNNKENLTKDEAEFVRLWESVKKDITTESIENDSRAETLFIRDEDGKIFKYEYKIFKKNKAPLEGNLTREEMNSIYRLYSYYGDSLTQRVISRHFSDLSLIDFKRILRAFNITKASAPFAPHMIEEFSEDELRMIQLREKENSFLRKAEEDQIKNNEKLLKKYAQENIDLKNKLDTLSNFKIEVNGNITPHKFINNKPSNKGINLYISDVHLGATVVSGTLYKENMNYGFEEAKRRLSEILNKLTSFENLDFINVILLGDNVDCCGFDGLTARRDHVMPQNMDARNQAEKFIELMVWFAKSLNNFTNNINFYSVPEGNHDGSYGRMIVRTLFMSLNVIAPHITTTLWEEFFGEFEVNGHVFICTHGKDSAFRKRGMPLILDDKTKVLIYEYLDDRNIYNENIHVIKGDLHSNNVESCKRFDYRNVLSLFGASDYSNMNFSRNSYGLSFDLFIGNQMIRGTFENM